MSEWAPKRFWKKTEASATQDGFGVLLDGRPVRTPAKAVLNVPSKALADRIAAEFDAQTDKIDPTTMPFTRTANAAIDKVSVQHAEVADMLADYGDSDLLCYRASDPAELVQRQSDLWDPLLEWAAQVLNARLEPRIGVIHATQSAKPLHVLRTKVHDMSAFELAAFHDLVSISGSLILGFAAKFRAYPAETLWDLSRLDETWQEEQWGVDDEAQKAAEHKKAGFLHASEFISLVDTNTQAYR